MLTTRPIESGGDDGRGRRGMAAGAPGEDEGHDHELRLSAEEVAELTERVLERSPLARSEVPRIPVATYLPILAAQGIAERDVLSAVAEVVRGRSERLSSVVGRKASELERMLFALLGRLDASFAVTLRHAAAPAAGAGRGLGCGPRPAHPAGYHPAIEYRVTAEKGELVIAASAAGGGGERRLFTLVVQGARRPGWLARLRGQRGTLPRRVVVVDPYGFTLERLILRALRAAGDELDAAVAFALDGLRPAVLGQLDSALGIVRGLHFDPGDDA